MVDKYLSHNRFPAAGKTMVIALRPFDFTDVSRNEPCLCLDNAQHSAPVKPESGYSDIISVVPGGMCPGQLKRNGEYFSVVCSACSLSLTLCIPPDHEMESLGDNAHRIFSLWLAAAVEDVRHGEPLISVQHASVKDSTGTLQRYMPAFPWMRDEENNEVFIVAIPSLDTYAWAARGLAWLLRDLRQHSEWYIREQSRLLRCSFWPTYH